MVFNGLDYPPLIAVAVVGFIHGLEPGHGWVPAALLSLRSNRRYLKGVMSATIISVGHFLSSIVVVILYLATAHIIDFGLPVFRYVAAAILFILSARFLTERVEEHGELRDDLSLKGIVLFAVVLGFAHEENFMMLALIIGGVEPLLLISVYALSITISLTFLTLMAIKTYSIVEHRIKKVSKYTPKITGLILALLGILFLLDLL